MPRGSHFVVALAALALTSACGGRTEAADDVMLETATRVEALPRTAVCEDPAAPVGGGSRGMWVWGTSARLDDPNGATSLLASAKRANLSEVYVSVNDGVLGDPRMPAFVTALVDAGLRVEALMGEATWYQPAARGEMLGRIDEVAAWNAAHAAGFAAVHLDVEPHQLPQNQGDHAFLPALATALGEATAHAKESCMSTSADLPRFALDEAGTTFAVAVPRVFVMLYELSEKTTTWLIEAGDDVLEHTFTGLPRAQGGRLVVSIRVEDYQTALGTMVSALDTANGDLARYGGWAIHDEATYRTVR